MSVVKNGSDHMQSYVTLGGGLSMRQSLKTLAFPTALIAVLASAFLLLGCSDMPSAPAVSQSDLKGIAYVESRLGSDPFATLDSVGHDASALGKLIGTIYSDNDTVQANAEGGTIDLLLGNAVSSLEIPENALSTSVLVTVVALQVPTPYGDVTLYDFGPDGLSFSEPAVLTLETDLPKGTVLHLSWFDPATDRWEFQESAETDLNGKVEFHIRHFSKYGIT